MKKAEIDTGSLIAALSLIDCKSRCTWKMQDISRYVLVSLLIIDKHSHTGKGKVVLDFFFTSLT